jgi:hypothetical protein
LEKVRKSGAAIAWLCKELNIATLTESALFFHRCVPTITKKIQWMIDKKFAMLNGLLEHLKKQKN